ncbi:MAG: hypothetical protein SWE60_26475 [Thermodesulfobacteriota bacterium]|nr:hypothetical protein [Thermodesulfobacteriota bacterium]
MITERRRTAIAIYTNGIGYLKALDAEEKRLSLSRNWCPEIHQVNTSERY